MAEDQKETSDASESEAAAPEKSAEKSAEDKAEESAWDAAGDAMDSASEKEEKEEGPAKESEKGLSPEAIQKRLEALGGETEEDRATREAEEKLAERRQKMKARGKGRGKSGLQSAASKKLSDIGSKGPVKKKKKSSGPSPYSALATSDDIEGDALLETASRVQKWLKKNSRTASMIVGAAVVIGVGVGGWFYMQHKKDTAASTTLEQAVTDVNGRIGDPDKVEDEDRPKDTTPIFKTVAERQDAALSKFREVSTKYPGTGAAYLARLSEGSLLLDKHDLPGAIAAFIDVKDSPLAKVDAEVHGRALENLGFAYELKADEGEAAAYNDALKTFRELENTDTSGFQELGEYHQARIFEKQGDKDQAKELLKKVYAAVTKPGEGHPYPYLENVAEDRLRTLDPTALPPKRAGSLGGPMGNQMSEAQMRQLIEQMKKTQQQQGDHGHP